MINSSKAPRKSCLGFAKLDGSNIRVKYSPDRGFNLFGTRHTLMDESHPHLGEAVALFHQNMAKPLTDYFKKAWRREREIVVFAEFFGAQSFAGIHVPGDPKQLVIFDILIGHKMRKFIPPREFVKHIAPLVPTPELLYEGNLNEQLIADVRHGKYPVDEGMICKGTETTGSAAGGIWMCKIKTQAYLDKIKARHPENWQKFWE